MNRSTAGARASRPDPFRRLCTRGVVAEGPAQQHGHGMAWGTDTTIKLRWP